MVTTRSLSARQTRSSRAATFIACALRFGLHAAAAVLLVFHVVLLAADLDRGRLTDPMVAGRWAVAGALFAVLIAFWRRGVPLLRGRRAAVLWLLVLVLHGVAQPPDSALTAERQPVGTGDLVLILWPALITGLAAAGLATRHSGRRLQPRPAGFTLPVPVFVPVSVSRGYASVRAARPPPAR